MMRMAPGELQIFSHWHRDHVFLSLTFRMPSFPVTIKQRMKCQRQLDSRYGFGTRLLLLHRPNNSPCVFCLRTKVLRRVCTKPH